MCGFTPGCKEAVSEYRRLRRRHKKARDLEDRHAYREARNRKKTPEHTKLQEQEKDRKKSQARQMVFKSLPNRRKIKGIPFQAYVPTPSPKDCTKEEEVPGKADLFGKAGFHNRWRRPPRHERLPISRAHTIRSRISNAAFAYVREVVLGYTGQASFRWNRNSSEK